MKLLDMFIVICLTITLGILSGLTFSVSNIFDLEFDNMWIVSCLVVLFIIQIVVSNKQSINVIAIFNEYNKNLSYYFFTQLIVYIISMNITTHYLGSNNALFASFALSVLIVIYLFKLSLDFEKKG